MVRYSEGGANWSRKHPAIPPSSTFGSMLYFKGKYWMAYSVYTGNYSVPSIMNNHDLFIARSESGVSWEKAARLSSMPPYNYSLYLDAETDGENIWIAYTSTIKGNAEVYIRGSPDGTRWSRPTRLTRNVEYIESLEDPFSFKCDEKDLLIDDKGRGVVVYESAKYPQGTIFITHGQLELKEISERVEYNLTLPYGELPVNNVTVAGGEENNTTASGEEDNTTRGYMVLGGAIAILAVITPPNF